MIHNNEAITQTSNAMFKAKSGEISQDKLVSDVIQPVINVQPHCNFVINSEMTGRSYFNWDIPLDKDTYLCGAYIGAVDTTSSTISSNITSLTEEGDSIYINVYCYNQGSNLLVYYNPPIKLKKGSQINYAGVHEGGFGQAWGYTI